MNHYGTNISTTNHKIQVNKSANIKFRKVNINKKQKTDENQPVVHNIEKYSNINNTFHMKTKIFQNTETKKIIIKRKIEWKENNVMKKRYELQEFNFD